MDQIFVTCPGSVELLLLDELKEMGIEGKKSLRGVFVPKTPENVYTINYNSRLATRVLWPLVNFRCRHKDDLYNFAKKINWSLYIQAGKTFAIDSNVSHPNLRNSLFAAFIVKDAICDQFREKTGVRPSIDVAHPDVQLNLFINNEQAILSLDTSGDPLFKRGYRQSTGPAPIQESVAAAILRKIGYTSSDILIDPFCGSGTFLIEAALIATQTPPGFFRKKWGFINLPDFSEEIWQATKAALDSKRISLTPDTIFGYDKDRVTLQSCLQNVRFTKFPITCDISDIQRLSPKKLPTLLIGNPPMGKDSRPPKIPTSALANS
ncbi:MAG: THUMP domain-containing protein [Rhabdochlamydiaceae bacterium]|jgi:putative N6-adenine-specific DNA methylase